jgi:hypothetical protein
MYRRFIRTCCFHRLGSLPAHLFKTSVRTRLHVTRWKRVTYLFVSVVACGQTDSDSAYALLCTDVKVADGTVQRVSLLRVRCHSFIFPARKQYTESNFVFLSVLPGRCRDSASYCTATTTLHILFNLLFAYCPINEHHIVGATENVRKDELPQSSHSLIHFAKNIYCAPYATVLMT